MSDSTYSVAVTKTGSESTKDKAARLRSQQQRGERTRNFAIIGGAAAVAIALVAGAFVAVQKERGLSDPTKIEGLIEKTIKSGEHTTGTVTYDATPPMGGKHNPQWLNCAVYNKPQVNENAVHSLEHGAVWITYNPDLPKADVDKLAKRAKGEPFLLVSPYPGLKSPVVASAWGKQVFLDGVNDPRLERFIRSFANGPQTPEPGAVCFGGLTGDGLVLQQ